VCIHINLNSRASRQKQRAMATKAVQEGTSQLYGGQRPNANAKAVAGLGGVFASVPSTIGQLVFTGVAERHPALKIALIETGIGWIPHLLEQMDDRYWRNRSWGQIPISEPPSFYWYRNFSATFITDRNGIENRHGVGIDNIMWSTDYPHHGNDWPYSRKSINDMMGHIPTEERHKIVSANAVRIFGLD
jgi:predicted TIM-barrel fold metal-dependent hydrolase